MVIDHLGLLFEQSASSVLFVLNDLAKDFLQPLDNGALRLAESHLVGDLEYVAQCLGALPIQAADSQPQLIHRLNNWIDLLSQHQSRQVQHCADPNASANVGG